MTTTDPTEHRSSDGVEVDLRADGLLWLINSTVFHPRGFALAEDTKPGPDRPQFLLLGDGTEPWQYASKEIFGPVGVDTDAAFANVRDLFERAARENGGKF